MSARVPIAVSGPESDACSCWGWAGQSQQLGTQSRPPTKVAEASCLPWCALARGWTVNPGTVSGVSATQDQS